MDDIIRSWKDPQGHDGGPDNPAGHMAIHSDLAYGGAQATTEHIMSWGCGECHWLTLHGCS